MHSDDFSPDRENLVDAVGCDSWRLPDLVDRPSSLELRAVSWPDHAGIGLDAGDVRFAMALQNLFWGMMLPLSGMLADRIGPLWVIGVGALIYAFGTAGITVAETAWGLHLTGGVLVGTGVAFTAFSLATAAMVRVVGVERRSFIMGLGTARFGRAGALLADHPGCHSVLRLVVCVNPLSRIGVGDIAARFSAAK